MYKNKNGEQVKMRQNLAQWDSWDTLDVLVSIPSLKSMDLGPWTIASLFVTNGEILGHSPILKSKLLVTIQKETSTEMYTQF